MRGRISEIRARGAELVIVGNGSQYFAQTFREDQDLDCPLLIDPELRAYRAAGLRRGRVELLSPRVPLNALDYCLEEGGLSLADIDCIAYYESPQKKLERQIWTQLQTIRDGGPDELKRFDPMRPLRELSG